jgi:hypothetical protein
MVDQSKANCLKYGYGAHGTKSVVFLKRHAVDYPQDFQKTQDMIHVGARNRDDQSTIRLDASHVARRKNTLLGGSAPAGPSLFPLDDSSRAAWRAWNGWGCSWRKLFSQRRVAFRSQSFLVLPSSLMIGRGCQRDDLLEVGLDHGVSQRQTAALCVTSWWGLGRPWANPFA